MKISLLLVIAALVAVAEVCGQPVESVSGPLEEIQRWKRDDTDKETICVSADNKFYLYANSVKLYTCYSQVPKGTTYYGHRSDFFRCSVLSQCLENNTEFGLTTDLSCPFLVSYTWSANVICMLHSQTFFNAVYVVKPKSQCPSSLSDCPPS